MWRRVISGKREKERERAGWEGRTKVYHDHGVDFVGAGTDEFEDSSGEGDDG